MMDLQRLDSLAASILAAAKEASAAVCCILSHCDDGCCDHAACCDECLSRLARAMAYVVLHREHCC